MSGQERLAILDGVLTAWVRIVHQHRVDTRGEKTPPAPAASHRSSTTTTFSDFHIGSRLPSSSSPASCVVVPPATIESFPAVPDSCSETTILSGGLSETPSIVFNWSPA